MCIRKVLFAIIIFALLPLAASAQISLDIETAFENLSFSRPVDIQHAGDGSNRLFVLEQHAGSIRVFDNDQDVTSADLFLDLEVGTASEEGLLGLAFHPDYENNGYFFVYYSTSGPRRSVIARFSVDPENPNRADPDSELIILEITQPESNHNGGQLAFSPLDGFLYIGLGDGGGGGDPDDNGEDPKTLLGSILRIDVNNSTEANRYAIPSDNPFVGNQDGYKEEIFAYGLRNPWRFSIDPQTGDIWAGDVGQSAREEIDLIEKGKHYGWDIKEASLCFEPRDNCNSDGLTLTDPVWEYPRSLGISVTGGHVYRGTRVPEIAGKYIYADYVSGRIWALTLTDTDTTNVEIAVASFSIPAFGVSESGELFIAGFNGKLHRFVETQSTDIENPAASEKTHTLGVNYPNPAYGKTTIPFTLSAPAEIEIAVFDMLGRKVSVVTQGNFPEGNHVALWNGLSTSKEALPVGAYFYSLRIGETIIASQMLTMIK
ncbi:MAG: PQQ-dependent sugar dehydrogenase [Rhodothermales bacterium]